MPDPHMIATVLVVEDDMLVRMHGTDTLADAGYEVLEAGNADDALLILNGHDDVHVLFSDIDMPGSMDGLGLAHLVHERWPHIRLLLTSGHHPLRDEQLPARGTFVRKPWSSEALVDRIRNLLVA